MSSESSLDKGRIGEEQDSSTGVDGNKETPEHSEVGEEAKVWPETLEVAVSARARLNRSYSTRELLLAEDGRISP
jgi:hypothetical protein